MSIKLRYYVILGITVFLCSVIANAPATLAAKLFQSAGINAQSYRGSFWRGSASGLVLNIGPESVYVEKLDWQLHPFSLLLFSPTADISAQGPNLMVTGEAAVSGNGRWRLADAELRFPANLLGATTLGMFAGSMSLIIAELEVSGRTVKALQGQGQWRSASWFADKRWWALGDFNAELSTSSAADVLAVISDMGGPIGLNGSVQVDFSGNYRFSGAVEPRPAAPNELGAVLSVIGEQQAGNRYQVDFKGTFPGVVSP